jgi:type II secretory pathway pseudopilin PulG
MNEEAMILTGRLAMGHRSFKRRAFTIVEALVVVVILTVLALIAIPIIQSRVEEARLSRAKREVQALADAQMRVESDLGYFVRLFMLNDTPGGDGIGFDRANPTNDTIDGILDYTLPAVPYYPSGDRLFVHSNLDSVPLASPTRNGQLTTPDESLALLTRLADANDSLEWKGPYINWQTDNNFYDGGIVSPPGGEPGADGVPDDPWGNNYLFFTPIGVIPDVDPNFVSAFGTVTAWPFPLNSSNAQPYVNLDSVTDRYAILSMGPNGVPGNGPGTRFGTGDDIIYVFGRGGSSVQP